MKHILFLSVVAALLIIGCAEKKVDAEKLNHANALVNTGNFDEGINQLEELAKSSPSDPVLKQSLISAHMKYANYFMYNDSLAPRVKYPSALKHYREVLKLDGSNQNAKEGADMIIDIYKSMGREVPNV